MCGAEGVTLEAEVSTAGDGSAPAAAKPNIIAGSGAATDPSESAGALCAAGVVVGALAALSATISAQGATSGEGGSFAHASSAAPSQPPTPEFESRAPSGLAAGRWKRARSKVSAASMLQRSASVKAISRDQNIVDANMQRSIDPAFAKSFRITPDDDVPGINSVAGDEEPEPCAFEASIAHAAHHVSPVRWWVPRDDVDAATGPMATSARLKRTESEAGFHMHGVQSDGAFHKAFWYDAEAVLSRKASVRFRRSVDVMLPSYGEEVCGQLFLLQLPTSRVSPTCMRLRGS